MHERYRQTAKLGKKRIQTDYHFIIAQLRVEPYRSQTDLNPRSIALRHEMSSQKQSFIGIYFQDLGVCVHVAEPHSGRQEN